MRCDGPSRQGARVIAAALAGAIALAGCATSTDCRDAQHQHNECLKLMDWADRGHCIDDTRAALERCQRRSAGAQGA